MVVLVEKGGKINISINELMIMKGSVVVKLLWIVIIYFCCLRCLVSGVIDCLIIVIIDW